MKASTLFKYAVAITYGIFVGKALGLFTEGIVLAATDDMRSKKNEPESEKTETE